MGLRFVYNFGIQNRMYCPSFFHPSFGNFISTKDGFFTYNVIMQTHINIIYIFNSYALLYFSYNFIVPLQICIYPVPSFNNLLITLH